MGPWVARQKHQNSCQVCRPCQGRAGRLAAGSPASEDSLARGVEAREGGRASRVPSAASRSMAADRRAKGRRGRRGAPLRLWLLLVPVLLTAGCVTINLPGGKPGPLEEVTVTGEGRDKVLVVDLSGLIVGETRTGLLGFSEIEGMVDRVRAQLEKAARDRAVRALVLRINSPGGTVTASDIIYA